MLLRSRRTVAFVNLAGMSSPLLSDKSASKAHSDRVGTSLAHPSSSSTSSDEESLSDVPLRSGYEWVDSGEFVMSGLPQTQLCVRGCFLQALDGGRDADI